MHLDDRLPCDKTILGEDDAFNIFFSEAGARKHLLHVVFFEFEATVVDEVRTGTDQQLSQSQHFISATLDAVKNSLKLCCLQ